MDTDPHANITSLVTRSTGLNLSSAPVQAAIGRAIAARQAAKEAARRHLTATPTQRRDDPELDAACEAAYAAEDTATAQLVDAIRAANPRAGKRITATAARSLVA